MRAILPLLSALLPGCLLLPEHVQEQALDPDGDEVSWWEDCDSSRLDLGAPASIMVYTDADGDGYGDPDAGHAWEGARCPELGDLVGEVLNGNDCDDSSAEDFPNAAERCDGLDNDCDGALDEGGTCAQRGETTLDVALGRVYGSDTGLRAGAALLGGEDMDGDGEPDLVVGAPGRADSARGGVYLRFGPLTGLDAGEALDTPTGGSSTDSPDAHALAWTWGGEDLPSVLAGAPLEESGLGEAWLLHPERDATQVEQLALRERLSGTSVTPSALGLAVAGLEVGDGSLLALGAPETDPGDEGGDPLGPAGAVFLLDAGAGDPTHASTLLGDAVGGYAGAALAGGDLDGDGLADLAVGAAPLGAPGEIVLALGVSELSGELRLGDVADARWMDESDEGAWGLGTVLALAPDLTGDGYDDLLVGAPGYATSGAREYGMAMLLRGSSTVSASFSSASARYEIEEPWSNLGASVATIGDVDGDEVPDLGLGAPGDDSLAPNAGAAWIVYGPIGMEGETQRLSDEDCPALAVLGTENLSRLGSALAPLGPTADGKGDTLLIAAPEANTGEAEAAGEVWLFAMP